MRNLAEENVIDINHCIEKANQTNSDTDKQLTHLLSDDLTSLNSNYSEFYDRTKMQLDDHLKSSSTSSCASSSSDSGVIIIDNLKSFNAKGNCETINGGGIRDSFKKSSPLDNNISAFANNTDVDDKSSTTINIEHFINLSKSKLNGINSSECDRNARQSATPTVTDVTTTTTTTTKKKVSPTLSIRSTTISIVSIDENADDSSVIDSDSEYDVDSGVNNNYVIKKLGQQTTYPPNSKDIPNIGNGMTVVSQKINGVNGPLAEIGTDTGDPPTTSSQIGSIALTNSTDVTFGDKHFYEGPVTIQQFLIDSRKKWKPVDGGSGGLKNPLFENAYCSDGDVEGDGRTKETSADGNHKSNPQADIPEPYKFIFNRKAVIITGSIIVLTILASALIAASSKIFRTAIPISKLGDGEDYRKNIPINSTIGVDNIGGGQILRIIPRDGWLAQPPTNETVPLKLPAHRVVIAHTATEGCNTQAACTYRTRFIQTFNIESSDYVDIIYNFLVGGDGNVYEGRGWDIEGAHTKGYNSDSIGLAFIGTFKNIEPNEKQINVAKLLIDEGVRLNKLAPKYRLYGARQLETTTSPGDVLYEKIKKWPHWCGVVV